MPLARPASESYHGLDTMTLRPGTRVQYRPTPNRTLPRALVRCAGLRGLVIERTATGTLVAFDCGRLAVCPTHELHAL